ncbi:hypothetical protein F2P81_024730 [Scophthalmus maximus]|uniref:Uncharacterized protein n=1 Tax=Scophthalmus maximus TaxID=52904 RepID=A0A6A4RR61_SCOMX|nr:hypothetical protein F2P81_024730 [Scophthalmus maximus]
MSSPRIRLNCPSNWGNMAQEEESALQDTRSGFISIKKKEKQKKDEGMKTQSSSGYRRVSDECDLRRLDGGADEGVKSKTKKEKKFPREEVLNCWNSTVQHEAPERRDLKRLKLSEVDTWHVMFFYAHDMSGDAELNVVVSVMSRHHK